MDYKNKSKEDLIAELKNIKDEYNSLSELYNKKVTKKKTSQEVLFNSENMFRVLFEQTVGYCMILDPNVENGIPIIIDANIAACETHCYTRDELIGRPITDINDGNSKKHVKEKTEQIMNDESFTYESTHIRKDGSVFPVVVYAKKILMENGRSVIFSHEYDISEKNAAEQKLIEAKEIAENKAHELEDQKDMFEIMFNTISDGIVITNSERIIKHANIGMDNLFGYKPKDIIGKSSCELFSDYDEYINLGNLLEEKNITEKKYVIANLVHKNGSVFRGETYCKKLYDYTGEYIGNIGYMRDVSERETFINDLKIAKLKAEESALIKTAFLQNLSHEIRTPLNAICGFSDLLDEPNTSNEKRGKYVSIIQNSSTQLLSIVSDVLTISSLETNQEIINVEKVYINKVIIDLLAVFKKQLNNNNNVSLYATRQLTDKQAYIYTDKTKLTQVLSNMISNAIKFTHKGFIQFGYTYKNEELEFFVKDTGIGIKQSCHGKIFERFRQANRSTSKLYGGTGLGLAISKGFIELLGGTIWVNSKVNVGTNMFFTLPYKPVEVLKESVQIKTYNNYDKKTILIVDDEHYNYLITQEMFVKYNFKFLYAENGKEAIDIFINNKNIDLILMDIKMPIMDGYKAAKYIKELDPFIPIIAQSAYSDEANMEKYSEFFDEYISKPASKDNILQKVAYCLENVTNNGLIVNEIMSL